MTQVKERLATAPTTLALGVGMAVALLLGGCGDASPTRAAMAWSGDEPRVDDDRAPGSSEDAGTNDVVSAAAVPEVVIAPAAVPAPPVPDLAPVGPNTVTQTVQPVTLPPNLAAGKPQAPTPGPSLVANPPVVLSPEPLLVATPFVAQYPKHGPNKNQAPTSGPNQAPTSDPNQAPTPGPNQVPNELQKQNQVQVQVQNQVQNLGRTLVQNLGQNQTGGAPQAFSQQVSMGTESPVPFGSLGQVERGPGSATSSGGSNMHQAQAQGQDAGQIQQQKASLSEGAQTSFKRQPFDKISVGGGNLFTSDGVKSDPNARQDTNDAQLLQRLNKIASSYEKVRKSSQSEVVGNDRKGTNGGGIFGGAGGASGHGQQTANSMQSATGLKGLFKTDNQSQILYANQFSKDGRNPPSLTSAQINKEDVEPFIENLCPTSLTQQLPQATSKVGGAGQQAATHSLLQAPNGGSSSGQGKSNAVQSLTQQATGQTHNQLSHFGPTQISTYTLGQPTQQVASGQSTLIEGVDPSSEPYILMEAQTKCGRNFPLDAVSERDESSEASDDKSIDDVESQSMVRDDSESNRSEGDGDEPYEMRVEGDQDALSSDDDYGDVGYDRDATKVEDFILPVTIVGGFPTIELRVCPGPVEEVEYYCTRMLRLLVDPVSVGIRIFESAFEKRAAPHFIVSESENTRSPRLATCGRVRGSDLWGMVTVATVVFDEVRTLRTMLVQQIGGDGLGNAQVMCEDHQDGLMEFMRKHGIDGVIGIGPSRNESRSDDASQQARYFLCQEGSCKVTDEAIPESWVANLAAGFKQLDGYVAASILRMPEQLQGGKQQGTLQFTMSAEELQRMSRRNEVRTFEPGRGIEQQLIDGLQLRSVKASSWQGESGIDMSTLAGRELGIVVGSDLSSDDGGEPQHGSYFMK